MKKLAILALAVAALSACSETTPTAILAEDASLSKATSVAAEVLGSFSVGSGSGGWQYLGENQNIECDREGFHGIAWNTQSGKIVPGQTKYCAQSGMTNYSVIWPARYVDNRSTTHLNFEDDVNVKEGNKGEVVGQGTTAWADVVIALSGEVVGQARVNLTQYTGGQFVGNHSGYACLRTTTAVTLEVVLGGLESTPTLSSLCW
jgi:hypothetical protein